VFLGAVYNGLLSFEFDTLRVASVLGRIGLAWAGAALAILFLRLRGQIAVFFAVLVAHSIALLLVAAPGLDAVSLEPGMTFGDWFDRHMTPGRLYRGDRDPEGLFGVLPAIGTALLGSFAGRWLGRGDLVPRRKLGGLVLAGTQCLLLGWLFDLAGLPINKNLWTASFVFFAGGWSLLLLALFHWIFDMRSAKRLALVFTVVGANAILAYVAGAFIDFRDIIELVFGRALERDKLNTALVPVLALCLQWGILFFLYRRRIFLRV
jgi:predicted acyltransferase